MVLFYYILLGFAITKPNGFKLSPFGYRICIEKCLHVSGCELIKYSRTILTCQSLEVHSKINLPDSVYRDLSTAEKPCAHYKCSRPSRCILTRLSGFRCVPPIRTQNMKSTVTEEKRLPTFKSHIQFSKGRKEVRDIIGFIATRVQPIELHLFYLDRHLPTVKSNSYKGMMKDMKTWGNFIYWCQERPAKCVKMEFNPRSKTFHEFGETALSCVTIAVDEAADTVFIGGYHKAGFTTTTNFRTKGILTLKKRSYTIQTCLETRRLYVGYVRSVGVFTYEGKFLKELKFEHKVEAMDIGSSGYLYTTDGAGHLSLVSQLDHGNRIVFSRQIPQNVNPNVFATFKAILIIKGREITSFNKRATDKVNLAVKSPIKRSQGVKYAAVYRQHQLFNTSPSQGKFKHGSVKVLSRKQKASTSSDSKRSLGFTKAQHGKQKSSKISGSKGSLVPTKVPKDCKLSKETIVIATSLHPSAKECTQLTKVNLKTGSTSTMEFIQARVVDLDIDEFVCYWCQAGPNGIYQHNSRSTSTEIRLLKESCHAIAGDTSLNLVFYATTDYLTRYSINETSKKLMDIRRKNTDLSQLRVFLDRRERIVYICSGKGKSIIWSKYDLEKKRTFDSYQPSKAFSISNGMFYYTNENSITLRQGNIVNKSWSVKYWLKIYATILDIVPVGNKVVVKLKRSVRVYCKDTFKEVKVKLNRVRLLQRSPRMFGMN